MPCDSSNGRLPSARGDLLCKKEKAANSLLLPCASARGEKRGPSPGPVPFGLFSSGLV